MFDLIRIDRFLDKITGTCLNGFAELGLRTNGELYLAYFIIYNIIMEFYTDTISATYAEFVRVEDIVRKVDDTTAGIVDK